MSFFSLAKIKIFTNFMKNFNYLSRRAWIRLISLRSMIVCNRDIKSEEDGAPSNL